MPSMEDTYALWLLQYWLLQVARPVLQVLDCVWELTTGVSVFHGKRKDRLKAEEDYGCSGQLVKIVARAKHSPWRITWLSDFLCVHQEYVHPEYALNNSVSLLSLEEDCAVFCVTDEDTDILDTTRFPFLFVSQYLKARRLLILPMESFHRLAHELGDPKVPVGVVHMTARSGSTLLAQMANRVPGTRTIAENWSLVNLRQLLAHGNITKVEGKRMLRSAVRLICKTTSEDNVQRIFVKMTIMDAMFFPGIAEMFPKIKLIFNTRLPLPSLRSYRQAFGVVSRSIHFKLSIHWREIHSAGLFFPLEGDSSSSKYYNVIKAKYNTWFKPGCLDEHDLLYYAGSVAQYLDHKHIYHSTVFYEDLSRDPESEMKKVFSLLDMSEDHLPLALSALGRDSQNSTFGERKKGRSHVFAKEFLEKLDVMMAEIGAPEITQHTTEEEFKKFILGGRTS